MEEIREHQREKFRMEFDMHSFVPPFRSHCIDEFERSIGCQITRSALPALCKFDELGKILHKEFIHCVPCSKVKVRRECEEFEIVDREHPILEHEEHVQCEDEHKEERDVEHVIREKVIVEKPKRRRREEDDE